MKVPARNMAVLVPAICLVLCVPGVLSARFEMLTVAPCQPSGDLVRIPDLPEASGIAASRMTAGVLWAHNDSGPPIIVALDERGAVIGRVRVTGAENDDWEDVAVGSCPQGTCLYIADIGDNNGRRDRITVYRIAEPKPTDARTAPVEVFHAKYPDGAHDAEALFVTPTGGVFIITKGDPGPIALYRFPRALRTGLDMALERVGDPIGGKNIDTKDRPTAADVSQDGEWIAVRTVDHITFYRAADLIAGRWREASRADLSGLKEPRGEGIAFGARGTVFLAGEGGGSGSPGTLVRLTCTLAP